MTGRRVQISAMMHRMTFRDFLLFGCSVAILVVLLWPTGSAKQLIGIRTDSGTLQQYSVTTNDPSLSLLKRRFKSWEKETSSRPLRVARWHHQLAEFYSLRIRSDQESDIAQVSYTDSDPGELDHDAGSFWSELRDDAKTRIAEAQRDIRIRHDSAVSPVTFGSVTQSIGSPLAYPIAIFVASVVVVLAVIRQRFCPPIELKPIPEVPSDRSVVDTIHLQVQRDWIRIGQPIEVLLWRGLYATSVCSAAIFLSIANLV